MPISNCCENLSKLFENKTLVSTCNVDLVSDFHPPSIAVSCVSSLLYVLFKSVTNT